MTFKVPSNISHPMIYLYIPIHTAWSQFTVKRFLLSRVETAYTKKDVFADYEKEIKDSEDYSTFLSILDSSRICIFL